MSSYCTVFSLQPRSIRQGSGSELELSDFPPQSRYTCKSLFIAQLSVGRVGRLSHPRQVDCWDKIRVFHLALLRSSSSHLLTFASRRGELHVERKRHKLTNTSAELLWMCTQPHSIARIKYLGMSVLSDAKSCPRCLA